MGFLSVGLPRFPQLKKRFWNFWILLWQDISIFRNSRKRRLSFQIVTNSLKSWETGIFQSLLDFIFIRLWGSFFRHGMFVEGRRGPNLRSNYQFSRKINVHVFIKKIFEIAGNTVFKTFLCWHQLLDSRNVFGTNDTC